MTGLFHFTGFPALFTLQHMLVLPSFLWLSNIPSRIPWHRPPLRGATDAENKLTVTISGGWGINWETGNDTYALLYIKQITNKDQLYSTGNSTQYSVMAYMGKESKKRVDGCICITESLCCTPETNTTLLINYAPI